MHYLWYSRKQSQVNRGKELGEMIVDDDLDDLRGPARNHIRSFKRASQPPHAAYGDVVFYTDDNGNAHIVSSVSRAPEHGSGWDDIGLVATAEKAAFLGGTKHGLNQQGRDFCAAKEIDATSDRLIQYITTEQNCALTRPITVGRALKLGRKSP